MNAMIQPQAEQAIAPFADSSTFEHAQRVGKALAASSLVPETNRGNLANVLIALDVAQRIGASPLSVMQSLYIVHGRPAWSASFLIATVNACGRFTPVRFESSGEDPFDKTYRCRAIAKDRESGEVCEGPWITWKMVEAEGWSKKSGSKWQSMPGLMFMYRAAAFWTRVYAPELSLGIRTAEEEIDVAEARTIDVPARGDLVDLEAKLQERALAGGDATEPEPITEAPLETFASVKAALEAATTRDALDHAADRASLVAEAAERAELSRFYQDRLARLEQAGDFL